MLELFDLLGSQGWRVYVCSGGGRDFMRVIAEEVWGVRKENVIGSAPEYQYKDNRLVRTAARHGAVALGPGKPEDIFARTGRLPRFAGGNGDVDLEMLEAAEFLLVILHYDADREFAYTDAAEELLAAAKAGGWTVASMKNDWTTIFERGE